MDCIKIGISQNYNTSSTSTTTTTTETTMTTNMLDADSTGSPFPDAVSTPAQTFPPRKTQKPPTTVVPKQISPSPAVGTAAPHPTNVSGAPTTVTAHQDIGFHYCDCDFQANLCEVNCCCDRDCPPQTLQVFNCLQSSVAPQLKARLEDFQYTHGLPTCQISDGWLCVFRSNTKPERSQPPSNNFDAEQYKKWPELLSAFEDQLTPAQFTAHYKFGQALQLWQPESKELSDLELPTAFEGSNCQLRQALRHLQPMRSNCLLSDATEMQIHLWTLANLTSSHQLLPKPRDLEDQEVQGIDIEMCQQLLQQPQMICGNETQLDMMVDSVELQLMHNYTHILSARLLLRETSVQDENKQLWLKYELIYKTATEEMAKPSSGPLGYLQGSPLLLATLQPQNSSDKKPLLSYYHNNVTTGRHQHWLTLCQHSVVNFGVDLAKKCHLLQLAPIQPEHGNHTDYCKELQAHIWLKLLPHNCTQLDDLGQVFVSRLGRPQADKWLPLQLDTAQQMLAIQGTYNEEQQSLSCRNMLLSVSYEFHVTETTLLEGLVPHQNVVQHARLVLGQRHDLEFDAGEQQVELPLAVSVMFFKARLNNAESVPILSSGLLIMSTITWLHFLTQ
ncbi:hypothetical protein ACLKA6_001353 [Drosophila palustris]